MAYGKLKYNLIVWDVYLLASIWSSWWAVTKIKILEKIVSSVQIVKVKTRVWEVLEEELFPYVGIIAIEHVGFNGTELTGIEIVWTFDNPESVELNHCKLIDEIVIGEDKLIPFSGVEMGWTSTIILRGASFNSGVLLAI
ncbi:T-complex protein 1 subunit beta-like [Morus notabilis]|uniref:T-complex protein 1 subunit beta-like n=1 Tax=Morus notabilis TaxID=981085 RepID=UPI000CED737E|nr:T-complex protein 1 subunit beta-like [Morus notabilis]